MVSYAVGIDMVEIERVRRLLRRHPRRFCERVYTEVEAAVSRGRAQDLAARFAAKEAVMKALGTGARGIAWRDIEILPNRRGKPLVYLHGRAQDRAREIGLAAVDVSLTHSREYAIAAVVGVRNHGGEDLEASREWLLGRLRERGLL